MLKGFKNFTNRGNIVDLAVAVVIGTAFGKIVDSLVEDIIMPPIGLLLGKVDFSKLYINLTDTHYDSLAQAKEAGAPTINYGQFINNVIDFFIIALVIYFLVKQWKKVYHNEEEAPAEKDCPFCLSSIPEDAVRCPECTSHLPQQAPVPEE
ncbi:large conductance mechanosensitive channel protein MscL [Pseudalkalibacillus caeni]|uniref:Large-conductance mechanosensitive channel n=1 Tax=Exobacillus caeni TaxID=2574798 RepID=A0A5R9F4Z7_9BACL|nr:large conductance mechanosensitive channel protein MscL [Pseudalkalibacillus caeni]TLS36718.1 large conductance mechanosensitive channel protein MscL [Pseudalkalibacillus caeni]